MGNPLKRGVVVAKGSTHTSIFLRKNILKTSVDTAVRPPENKNRKNILAVQLPLFFEKEEHKEN